MLHCIGGDFTDSEQAKELNQHPHWEWIEGEFDVLIDKARASLEICRPEDAFKHQEKIRILKLLKRLPQNVIDRET